MKIFSDFPQGSLEWLAVRAGVITASEADALFTPLWKLKDGKGPDTYLSEKLAEKWLGAALPSFSSRQMEDGSLREIEGIKTFQFQYDVEVRRTSFIARDDMAVGCSPDGLIGEDCGLELKCPAADTHVKYLLAGVLPPEYVVQVHFAMFVTGFPKWIFMSYRPSFPHLIITVHRDEKIIKTIEQGVNDFLDRLDDGYKKLVELNDGKEPEENSFRASVLRGEVQPKPQSESGPMEPENSDVIP